MEGKLFVKQIKEILKEHGPNPLLRLETDWESLPIVYGAYDCHDRVRLFLHIILHKRDRYYVGIPGIKSIKFVSSVEAGELIMAMFNDRREIVNKVNQTIMNTQQEIQDLMKITEFTYFDNLLKK